MPKERRGVPTAGEQGSKGRREDGLAQNGEGLVESGREPRCFREGEVQAKFELRHYPQTRTLQLSNSFRRRINTAAVGFLAARRQLSGSHTGWHCSAAPAFLESLSPSV